MHNTFRIRFGSPLSDNRKSKTCAELSRSIENLKWLGLSVFAFVLVVCGAVAYAQQPKKIPRIGYLSGEEPTREFTHTAAIRQGLRDLGYIEGQNIIVEYRYTEGKPGRFAELAAELVRLKVDVIVVVGGNAMIGAAKNATKTIPIVMTGSGTPVEGGFIESLAVPAATSLALQALTES